MKINIWHGCHKFGAILQPIAIIDASIDHGVRDSKHAYVPKTDIFRLDA